MNDFKIIHDTIHGSIKIDGFFLELVDSPEFQRLHGIHQLGLANLVYPGANHSRLEHSLGTYHIATKMCKELKVKDEEANIVRVASLLHDVGHPPYSHTLEGILYASTGIDHMEITKNIILGKQEIIRENIEKKNIIEILKKYGIDEKEVAKTITGSSEFCTIEDFPSFQRKEKRYLQQMIHGHVDADQIDYLLRDAHYTGVAYGVIDVDRLLQTLAIHDKQLVVSKNGLTAVEGLLVARGLMFSSVYFHKTVRIAETMLSRAVERIEEIGKMEIHKMIDSELMSQLVDMGGYQRDIALFLKYRKLFKKAYSISLSEMTYEERKLLARIDEKKRKEKEIELADRVGAPEGYVIIDLPIKELLLSEPRIKKTDVSILDGNKVYKLSKYSPLAKALKMREVADWGVMVATEQRYKEKVGKIAKKILFG
ncbi:MAG: HD domain-containing protein [Candidatus Thermoplasmatota archaeon]